MENVRPGEDDQMLDVKIDKLGKYYKWAKISNIYGWTFEEFVRKEETGAWAAMFNQPRTR